MLVIAFDGVLFQSLDARSMVLSDALAAMNLRVSDGAVRNAIVGRTFSEAARILAGSIANESADQPDDTALDIVALRADQSYTAIANRGLSLNTPTRDALQRAATVTRVVLRADCRRRDVDALLSLAGLAQTVSMTRCSDDPAPGVAVTDSPADFSLSLRRSYAMIAARMGQNQGLLGERGAAGVALEACALAEHVARSFNFDIAISVSVLNLPAR